MTLKIVSQDVDILQGKKTKSAAILNEPRLGVYGRVACWDKIRDTTW